MAEKYNVYVRSCDGKSKISKRAETLEAATQIANAWLGKIATWQGPTRAISMHGQVLTIEEAEERAPRAKNLKSLEELQEVLNNSDIADIVRQIRDALENAESCETLADFRENMRELLESAKSLATEIKTVRS
jgi:hypothetical protein